MSATVAVLGAVNVDLVVTGPLLPRPGETVTGGTFSRHHGGKGGNQAVAAARALGADGSVVMLGCVGEDELGQRAIDALRRERVDVSAIHTSAEAPTGVALIVVDAAGENQIAVAPGANLSLDPDHVRRELVQARPDIVLVSLEASRAATLAVAEWCRSRDVPLLVNPAPVQPWAAELLGLATYLTPNRHELAALVGGVTGTGSQARDLTDTHPGLTIVVTLGPDGALIVTAETREKVPAPSVEAVDTTGAGDCFNGVLAASLAEGSDMSSSVRRAVAAAAMSVAVRGAREGMPRRDAIDASLR